MSRFKIEDFPEHVQAQIRAKLKDYSKPPAAPVTTPDDPAPPIKSSGPNKTEANYRITCLRGLDARYESLTFRMSNGHRYTPDFVIFHEGKPVACHECKGGYALHSQQRARLAFDQCAKEFPGLAWVWAVKTPQGWRTANA
jgi:hypothetical protein